MRAFVAKVEEVFKIKREDKELSENFDDNINNYLIPAYQREYKWTGEMVETFLKDIKSNMKFLGYIMLERKGANYEIVDGQQRLTTLFLIFIALCNKYHNEGVFNFNADQLSIIKYIQHEKNFVLQNDSVGEFIKLNNYKYELCIDAEADIYNQKEKFLELFNEIESFINKLNSVTDIEDFTKKLKYSTLLIFINSDESTPIEEVYLDINDKAQQLDVEDIFKGYCFKKYDYDRYDELKNIWKDLKMISIKFKELFGYNGLDQYLYLYLLSQSPFKISERLLVDKQHYLLDKSKTFIESLLYDMVGYGNDIITFCEKINNCEYHFEDVCIEVKDNKADEYKVLKKMCERILKYKKKRTQFIAQYHKLPFMMLLHYLKSSKIQKIGSVFMLKQIISDYYVYSFTFLSRGKKDKEAMDRTLFEVLNKEPTIQNVISNIKELRKKGMDKFKIKAKFDEEYFFDLYSLLDNYDIQINFLSNIYSKSDWDLDKSFTLEHFIVPNNRDKNIDWIEKDNNITISLKKVNLINEYKQNIGNYLVIEDDLNMNVVKIKDIVSKIKILKEWFGEESLPNHISVIVNDIESLNSYKILYDLKGKKEDKDKIEAMYEKFLVEYFNIDHQENLLRKIEKKVNEVFVNS